MKKVLSGVSMLMVIFVLTACANALLQDYEDQPLRATGSPSLEEMGDLIESIASARGWAVNRLEPGVIEATLVRKGGKHRMDVEITYGTSSFSINYVNSDNMNYSERDGERRIHPLYNKWVGFLRRDIETKSSRL